MRISMGAGLAMLAAAGIADAAQAGCTRSVINRTPYPVTVGQDGGPLHQVAPHRSRTIRYERSGSVAVAIHCPTGAGTVASKPVFEARYDATAVLDRCYLDIDGGGTAPLALNNPRPGDIVVAPYGVSCPLPERGRTISARY